MSNLTSPTWWKAAAIRALRTAITIALPYLGAVVLFGDVPWLSIASAGVLGFVLSLATSLTGIAEADGETVPVWLALLERVTKTFAQALVSGIGTAVLLTDVNWPVILQAAAIAALGSLLLGVLAKLPEAAPANAPTAVVVEGAVPVVPVPVSTVTMTVTPADPDQPAAGMPPSGEYEPKHAAPGD